MRCPIETPMAAEILRNTAGTTGAIDVVLHYTPTDPFAVWLIFNPDAETPTKWPVARDVLAGGLATCSGIGAVSVSPAGPSKLCFHLGGPAGSAVIVFDRRPVEDFLRRSLRLVPSGQESQYLDIDGELTALLDGAR